MSNLTDFFPAGSGGGGLFYFSPKQMPKRWIGLNNVSMKYDSLTGITYPNQTAFLTAIQLLGGTYHQFITAENDTYQELSNITNANGGIFHGAISPLSNYLSGSLASIHEWRITIDGTEYNFIADTSPTTRNISNYIRSTIGNFPEGQTANNSAISNDFFPSNSYYSYVESAGTIGVGFTAPPFTFYSNEYKMFIPVNFNLMGGIEFEETLKVELKVNNIPGNGAYDRGFSIHSLY